MHQSLFLKPQTCNLLYTTGACLSDSQSCGYPGAPCCPVSIQRRFRNIQRRNDSGSESDSGSDNDSDSDSDNENNRKQRRLASDNSSDIIEAVFYQRATSTFTRSLKSVQ